VDLGLDSADNHKAGHGSLEIGAGVNRSGASLSAELTANLGRGWTGFANANASRAFGGKSIDYGAIAGARWRW
jgi:hypothetical protein